MLQKHMITNRCRIFFCLQIYVAAMRKQADLKKEKSDISFF